MTKQRLTKEDWLAAGFRALATDGPQALRAEALARDLKTTKGSFYWHFADLASFKAAMLELWRLKVATEVMHSVMTEPDPNRRLRRLADAAALAAPDGYGGRAIEPAVRAWALTDATVMTALKEVDQHRIAFVEQLLTDTGSSDPVLARLVYAAYLGADDLCAKHGMDVGAIFGRLMDLVGPDPSAEGSSSRS